MKLLRFLLLTLMILLIYSPVADAAELVLQPGPEGKDAPISTFEDSDHGTFWILITNYTGPNNGMIEFDLSSLPAGATINSATLELYEYGQCSVNMNSIDLHLNLGSWEESSVTWSNAPSYGPVIATNTGETTECEWLIFDVTSAVTDWYNGSEPNYGFRISGPDQKVRKYIPSSDNNDRPTERPILRINYTPGQGQAGIPTLSEWGMIIFALLMAAAAIVFLRRRNMAA